MSSLPQKYVQMWSAILSSPCCIVCRTAIGNGTTAVSSAAELGATLRTMRGLRSISPSQAGACKIAPFSCQPFFGGGSLLLDFALVTCPLQKKLLSHAQQPAFLHTLSRLAFTTADVLVRQATTLSQSHCRNVCHTLRLIGVVNTPADANR